jgi:hypothetical protein
MSSTTIKDPETARTESGREPFDERLAKAMAHPLRQRILEVSTGA